MRRHRVRCLGRVILLYDLWRVLTGSYRSELVEGKVLKSVS